MKAVVMEKPFELRVKELPTPKAKPGQVVIKVHACGICGSDGHGYEGKHFQFTYPRVMGHEFGGFIHEIGDGVSGVRIGDRVCAETNQPCKRCYLCAHGMPGLCQNRVTNGFDVDGGLAEYVMIPAENIVPVPEDMDLDSAVLAQPFGVSYHALHDRAAVKPGDTVLVIGAGGVGIGAMMVAKCMGARVIISDIVDYRLQTALVMGADYAVNSAAEDLPQRVKELTDGVGADVVLECVGGSQCLTLRQAVHAVRFRGIVITMGTFAGPEVVMDPNLIRWHEIDFRGSQGQYGAYAPTLKLLHESRFDIKPMCTHVFRLDGAQEAFDLLRHPGPEDRVIKILMKP